VPSQPLGAAPQPSPQIAPQAQQAPAQSAPDAGETQGSPTPPAPQRRFTPTQSIPSGGMISLNFNRADLVEIIHIIAQQLRLTYTIDPEVKGTVTINSAEPLRAEDLLPVFHQILRMNGAVAVRTGNLYHIMPIKDGKGLARPVGQGREDSFALQVIPARFFAVAELKRVLTPFLQPGGEIIENPRGNFLIVMDLPSNIQRLAEIADLIDVQVFAGTRMEIYQPKIASAEELAQEMTKVMQSYAASAAQAESFAAEFIALPRINQLLVISHSEAAWTYAKRWLDRIDVIAEGPGRRIFIYPVDNGKADELADVISQALGQPSTGRRDTSRTLQDLHRSTAGGMGSTTGSGSTGSPFGSSGSSGSSGSFGQQSRPLGAYAAVPAPGQTAAQPAGAPQPAAPQIPGAPRPATPGTQGQQQQQQQQEQMRIVPDPATNSLIIYGTVQEFQNIKNILKELDAAPRQVLIDALILQVDLKNNETFGVDYEILRRFGDVKIFDKTFNSRGALLSGALASFASKGGLSGVIGTGDTVRAFVTALMTDSRVKLLSSPSVLASDNRPARIQVGAEIPIPTGTLTTNTGTIGSSTTIQYRNTGRILTIIPQVNAQGLVNLQLKAEVSALGDNIPVGNVGETFPTFNTQDAETTAVVLDGETLVIGGLIGENKTRTRSGIPYLMDIPVFGRFFGTTNDTLDRTELIMLITPHVVRNRDEARSVTEDFKKSLSSVRNELERMGRERQNLQQRPLENRPALPGPLSDPPPIIPNPPPPAPAPSALLLMPGAPARSLQKTTILSNPERNAAPGYGAYSDVRDRTSSESVASVPPGKVTQSSVALHALSVTRPMGTMNVAPQPPVNRRLEIKTQQQWAVQVASLAAEKDAQTMADFLRQHGYDAYVMTVQLASQTWHRVRIGRFVDLEAANQLRNSLASSTDFKRAYVAAN
jgi:general secretion pathway protein D